MSIHFSNSTPPAPGGQALVTFQRDANGNVSAAYSASGGSGGGGVNAQTVSYVILAGDAGKIVWMNGTNLTATLPAAAPSSSFAVFIQNANATNLTVARNGHNVDGAAADLLIPPGCGIYISTDGTNWFTERGIRVFGGVNAQTANYLIVSGDDGKIISMNGSGLTVTLPATPPTLKFAIFIQNTSATDLTVLRNGNNIDGVAASTTVTPGAGVYISTDGTNWFTSRGIGTVTHDTSALTSGQLIVGNSGGDLKPGNLSGDVTTSGSTVATVVALQGRNVLNSSPSNNQALMWNASNNDWEPTTLSGIPAGAPLGTSVTQSASYTAGQRQIFSLSMAKTFAAWQVTEATGKKFRLQLYATSAARLADATRPYSVPLQLGSQHGCLLDIYINQLTVATTPFTLSPPIIGSNNDGTQATTIYAAITSLETGTQTIAVTVSYVPMES